MKKRFAAVLTSLLLIMLLVPAAAFATGGHTVEGDLNLTSGATNTTLENDGYTWDASTHTLTMQDLTVAGNIVLPKQDCTVNIKGNCIVQKVTRNDSGANQATLVKGVPGASFKGEFDVAGNLTFTDVTIIESKVSNGNVGAENAVLKLENSNITLTHLSWMTNGGIELVHSNLTVVDNDTFGQFWTEKITMDNESNIESFRMLSNYGNVGMEGFDSVQGYVEVPKNGSFVKVNDKPITIADESGTAADHFILRAPKEQCEISLKASPAEGGTVSGAGSYNMTSTATVKAEANKGYHFVQWEDEQGVTVSKDASYTFQVTQTQTLTAVFAKDSVTPTQPGSSDQGGSDDKAVETGDSSHMELWIALLAASMLGIAGTVVFRRRKA